MANEVETVADEGYVCTQVAGRLVTDRFTLSPLPIFGYAVSGPDKAGFYTIESGVYLEAGDIIVTIDETPGPLGWWRRRILGDRAHVMLYLGKCRLSFVESGCGKAPVVFESLGYGVVMRHALNYDGRLAYVIRPALPEHVIKSVLAEADNITWEDQAVYDYQVIPLLVFWRLLAEAFRLPVALKYHRDERMICSEAVAEAFWRAGVDVVTKDRPPMPEDFVRDDGLLSVVWRGRICKEIL